MFEFFKKENKSTEVVRMSEKDHEEESGLVTIGAGHATTQVAKKATAEAAKKFAKPDKYSGNRTLYDSGIAKKNAKLKLFQDGKTVIDPYTGEELVLTVKEAKMKYGQEWAKHLAESDHVKPLEQIFHDTKENVWNTIADIRTVANSDDNIRVSSRKFNNPKRSRTNREYVENDKYLLEKGVKITEKGKKQAIQDGDKAEKAIVQQLRKSAVENVIETGHNVGMLGAQNAGITALTMSGIMNVVSVIKGEKDSEVAIADTIKTGGKAAVTGYAMSGSLTVVSHSLSNSSSQFIQGLMKSNIPGTIITAVMITGDTLKRWGDGEINTQDCLIELGEKGLNMATIGSFTIAGQHLIPIPIVGGAVGALVGSLLTSSYYNNLIGTLKTKQFEHQERMRIIEECHLVAEQAKAFREELEIYLESYFKECRECFDSALSSMQVAFEMGDADGVIAGANDITYQLGGQVYFETVDQFKSFLDNDSVDIL